MAPGCWRLRSGRATKVSVAPRAFCHVFRAADRNRDVEAAAPADPEVRTEEVPSAPVDSTVAITLANSKPTSNVGMNATATVTSSKIPTGQVEFLAQEFLSVLTGPAPLENGLLTSLLPILGNEHLSGLCGIYGRLVHPSDSVGDDPIDRHGHWDHRDNRNQRGENAHGELKRTGSIRFFDVERGESRVCVPSTSFA